MVGPALPVRRTARPIPALWVPFVYGPLSYLLFEPFFGSGMPTWMGFVFLAGLLMWATLGLVWRVVEAFALREFRRDRAFSDAPPAVVEFPMEIVLYDAGAYIGADRGFAWFDEHQRLIFNGAACSFALAAGDFYKRGVIGGRDYYAGVPRDALRLGTYGRTAYVRFLPLLGMKGPTFRFALIRFLRRNEKTSAPRQWPPLGGYEEHQEPKTLARKVGPSLGRDPDSLQ